MQFTSLTKALLPAALLAATLTGCGTDDTEQIRKEMTQAADFFDEVKAKYFADDPEFKERSWGMSSDYEIAIDCRSTMIRVGTAIFGPRVY